MGHSFTNFRGNGFDAKDYKLEVWLRLLVGEVDRMPEPPLWLVEARVFWQHQSEIAINGLISVGLDKFLLNEERVSVLRKLVQQAFSFLFEFGDYVPAKFLNNLCGFEGHREFGKDMETELFLRYGRALLKLLDGKMDSYECA